MKQSKRKTAFLPCKSFKHDGVTLTVGVAEVTINGRTAPNEVYFLIEDNDDDTPGAFATFTPDKAVEIAECLLRFARQAPK